MESAPFIFDLAVDTKAVEDGGHFYIEGYASDFEIDRDDEAFEPGAFQKAMDSFLGSNPVLLFHHQYDKALGRVEELRADTKGLFMRARIDKPTTGDWAEDVVAKIKSGTIKGLSVGGMFKRREGLDGKPRIYEADLNEISVTPLPVNPRTLFQVATKAFDDQATKDGDQLVFDYMEAHLTKAAQRLDDIEELAGTKGLLRPISELGKA